MAFDASMKSACSIRSIIPKRRSASWRLWISGVFPHPRQTLWKSDREKATLEPCGSGGLLENRSMDALRRHIDAAQSSPIASGTMKIRVLSCVAALSIAAFAAESKDGWVPLFDGKTLEGWK